MTAKARNPRELEGDELILTGDSRWEIAERTARSSALSRATQLRDILLFIVRQTILRPDEPIHEFEIAHRVLGRRSDFNPLDDNIVRVQMAHLRKKLDLYFSTEGKSEDVVITVALGSYKPIFSQRSKSAPSTHSAAGNEHSNKEHRSNIDDETASAPFHESSDAIVTVKRPPNRHRWMLGGLIATALIALLLAGGCTALWVKQRDQQRSLDAMQRTLTPWKYEPSVALLWSGMLGTDRDTDVVLSDDSFLLIQQISKQSVSFNDYLSRTYISQFQAKNVSADAKFILSMIASKTLGNTSEFKLAQRILTLAPLSKSVHLYSSRQYMPALVKQNNVILIGGRISNPWEELFEGQLNFIEYTKYEGLGVSIVTNRTPAAGEPPSYRATETMGYCVVAYLPNPDQNGKVLLIEGTNSEATEAAGDFLLSEDQLSNFRKKLNVSDFPYFEVLLKIVQVRGTPLTATIEAYRTYPNLH